MYRLGQVAVQLNISPSMLRSLTLEWKNWLSEEASQPALLEDGRRASGGYSDEDLKTLQKVIELKEKGLSHEEVEAHLKNLKNQPSASEAVLKPEEEERQEEFLNTPSTDEVSQEKESNTPIITYRIGQVAVYLDISPFKLRELTKKFASWLSDEATTAKVLENGRSTSHIYDDEDIEVLQTILELQQKGLSDNEIEEQLEEKYADEMASLAVVEGHESNQAALTPTAMTVLGQALHQLSETQQALLNTQQSHRDMLSLVVNDALSIKEENERLRKRLRMLEEEMARLKESDWNHRLALEERLNELAREKELKRSWWDRLLGE